MWNWIATVAIKAVLEWLTSLLIRWKEKLEHVEQGRQEVKDALDKKNTEADKELEVITNTNTSFDASIDELRNRARSK